MVGLITAGQGNSRSAPTLQKMMTQTHSRLAVSLFLACTTLLVAVLLLHRAVTNSAQAAQGNQLADMIIAPPFNRVSVGDEFELEVVIWANGQEVDSASARLNFDPAIVEVLALHNDGSPFDTVLQSEFDNEAGTIDHQAGKLGGPFPSNQFSLVFVRMRALTPAGTEVTFNVTPPRPSLALRAGENVLDETGNAQIVVDADQPLEPCAPLPPTETPTEIPTKMLIEAPTDTASPLNVPVATLAPTIAVAPTDTPATPTPLPTPSSAPTDVTTSSLGDVLLPLVMRP